MPQENVFRKFWDAGYRRLVPIVPPDAKASPESSLAKRPEALGKAVGYQGSDGLWRGFDWLKFEPTEAHIDAWHASGAGVGLRMGAGLLAVDIDTLDNAAAQRIHDMAVEALGEAPVRIGRAPKRLLLYKVTESVPYQRVIFDDGLPCKPGAEARVELLTEGRQFVAHGVHPATRQPYTWDCEPTQAPLTTVTPEQITAFFEWLAVTLPKADRQETTTERHDVDQAQLQTHDAQEVEKAVAALPNTTALFPTYDDYIRVGYAIKGAMQDDEARGLELYQEWAARWEGGNDPEVVAADWSRMKPPFEIGAAYLYELAERHSGGAYTRAGLWFTPLDEQAADPFLAAEQHEAAAEAAKHPPIKWVRPMDWHGMEPAPREWEVEGWIPRKEVTLLYGDGGIGKTLLIHQYATAAAAGVNWLGQETRKAKVMCFFCEDSEDELHRRQIDICKALGLTLDQVDDNLRITSRKYMDNILALWDRNTGAMRRQTVYEQLRRDTLNFGADVLIVDTLADTFGGSEIDRAQVNGFVKSCLGALAQDMGGTLIALGHPSVAGKTEGRSGSTAWSNAARSRIYLRYPKGTEAGNVRELEGMKLNYGPKGALLKIKWDAGAFVVLAATHPGVDLNAFKDSRVAAGVPTVEAVNQAAVLRALAEAEAAGLALNLQARSSAYAPKVLLRQWREHVGDLRMQDIEAAIIELEKAGAVRPGPVGARGNRHAVDGFQVLQVWGETPGAEADNLSGDTGVFD